LPLDLLQGDSPNPRKKNLIRSYVQKLKEKLEGVHNSVRQYLNTKALQTKI